MLEKCKNHLDSVHEGYWQHLTFAVWFAGKLIMAGLAVIVHAICPAFCQNTGSRTIFELHDLLKQRAAKSPHSHDA